MTRTTEADLLDQAADYVRQTLGDLGLRTVDSRTMTSGGDVTLFFDGVEGPVEVALGIAALTVATPVRVHQLINKTRPRVGITPLLVADALPSASRAALDRAGWGWLDRRGDLAIKAPGLYVRTSVRPMVRSAMTARRHPINGAAAVSWALALLLNPSHPPGIREVGRAAGFAPSTMSAAAKGLRDASLVREDSTPLVPELFWELASAWAPVRTNLVEVPELPEGLVDVIVVADTLAAARHRAPISVLRDSPPDLYVATNAELRRLTRFCGQTDDYPQRGATVAVAPSPLVMSSALTSGERWSFVAPVVAALDLSTDSGRGAEILDGWEPTDGSRVW